MQERQLSNLYLVIFPDRDLLKIGKANDVAARLNSLRRQWGDPDTRSSWVFQAADQTVLILEKALHLLLHEHAVIFDHGDGRTEMFSLSALPLALKHLEMWSSDHQGHGCIVQGVPVSIPIFPNRLAKQLSTKRVARRVEALGRRLTTSLDDCTRRLRVINRIIARLARHQETIPFQWEQDKSGTVIFRLITKNGLSPPLAVRLMRLLSFQIEDSNQTLGLNLCSIASMGDVIQFSIRPPSLPDDTPQRLLDYLFDEIMAWLGKLPKKSSAIAAVTPAIDLSTMPAI